MLCLQGLPSAAILLLRKETDGAIHSHQDLSNWHIDQITCEGLNPKTSFSIIRDSQGVIQHQLCVQR